ncbi:hypothetical protein JVU11DRAFT_4528 [Chiua virens]|nr:hypothetical protein JVU11DRAFT_4528 [Chiua virens]
MDNFNEPFTMLYQMPDSSEPFVALADGQLLRGCQWEYDSSNNAFPLRIEQSELQSLTPHSHLYTLPTPPTTEQFAVPTDSLQLRNPRVPATRTADFSVPSDAVHCQLESQWAGMSSTFPLGDHAFVPPGQLPNSGYYETPHDLLCGGSREYGPSPLPTGLPSVSQSLSSLPTPPYLNMQQYSDAPTWPVLDRPSVEPHTSSPSGDTGFLTTLDYANDSYFDTSAADCRLQASIGQVTRNGMLPVHSAVMLPSNLSTPNHDTEYRQAPCTSDSECRWLALDGTPCLSSVVPNRRGVIDHLHHAHGIRPGDEKVRQTCLWEHCGTSLNKESLGRHILTVHLRKKVKCPECRELFAREDSLRRHLNLNLKGGQHHAPPCKHREGATAAIPQRKWPSWNHGCGATQIPT